MPRHSLSRKSISPVQPIAVLATALLIAGFFTATESVKASGSGELIGNFSSVCPSTGTPVGFVEWSHSSATNERAGFANAVAQNLGWSVDSYTTSTITSVRPSGRSDTNLGLVPSTKTLDRYIAYPFTTGPGDRRVLNQIAYGDSVATAINFQGKLFSVSAGVATPVEVSGLKAETAEITTSDESGYKRETFEFPATLLAQSQEYELRLYIWGPSPSITGYDDFLINIAECVFPSTSSSSPAPVVSLVSPDSPHLVSRNGKVSLFGTHFDTVTEVFVGGKKVEMRKISAYQVDITIPNSMSGLVDLEIKSTLNNVLSPKHFNLRASGTSSARGAELSVAGFEHNSRKLTKAMKRKIDSWLKQNPTMSTLTCTGFTSLPKRATDVALSTKRGNSVCNFAKRKNPDLEIVIRPGVEDPRPGSNIRRALLVLNP
jgi:hypothetical protein